VKRTIKDLSAAGGDADYYSVPKGESKKSVGKTDKKERAKAKAKAESQPATKTAKKSTAPSIPPEELAAQVEELRSQMFTAAENLEFETAARLRDQLNRIQESAGGDADAAPSEAPPPPGAAKGRSSSKKSTGASPKKKSASAKKTTSKTPSRSKASSRTAKDA